MRGWKALTVLLAVTALLCGLGTWTLITFVMPLLFPIGSLWPDGAGDLWAWMVGGAFGAMALGAFVDSAWPWTDRLPFVLGAGSAATATGAAFGAAAAVAWIAAADPTNLVAVLIAAVIALGVSGIAWHRIREASRDTREYHRERERIMTLQTTGTQARADVEAVHFTNGWTGINPDFLVTVRYDTPSGERRTTSEVTTSAAGAPIVGGTVLLWFSGDGSDTDNIHIEQDPDSIRDPDAAKTYEAPSDD